MKRPSDQILTRQMCEISLKGQTEIFSLRENSILKTPQYTFQHGRATKTLLTAVQNSLYKEKKGVNVESRQNHASSPPPPIYYAHCSSDLLVQIWEGVSPDRKPQSSQESHVPASLVRRRYTRPIVQAGSISAHRTLADDKVILTC